MKNQYTVEVYKKDRRTKSGEKLVLKKDHEGVERNTLKHLYETTYFAKDGFRFEIHETYVTRRNALNNVEFQERYDTPYYCSPSSETYWSS